MVSKNEKPSINIPKPKPKPKPEKKSLTAEEKFAIWKKARKDAYDEKKEIWNKYDSFIQQAMSEMKKYLQKYDNFNSELCPDWIWIKSMLWTEGHPVDFEYEWEHRPLRIGVAGDAGAPALLNKDEAISLVIPTGVEWQNLTLSKITNDPYSNIRAAIIYLMNKLSLSDQISVDDPNDKTIYTVKVSTADGHGTMDAIALDRRRIGTTKEILERENPGVNPTRLHNGQELRYCKGSKQRVIFGWRFPVNAAGNTYYKLPEEIRGFVDVADSCEYGISINDEYFIKENCSDIEGKLNSLKGKYSDKYILSILSIYDDTVIIYLDYKKRKNCAVK